MLPLPRGTVKEPPRKLEPAQWVNHNWPPGRVALNCEGLYMSMDEKLDSLQRTDRVVQPTSDTMAHAYIKDYETEYQRSIPRWSARRACTRTMSRTVTTGKREP